MNIITDISQGSEEWKSLRLGKITASCFDKVMAKGRGNSPSKTRQSYMMQLAAEILTQQPQDSFTNQYMEWGNECEPQARSMYEFNNNVDVEEVAFIELDEHVGVSPDGLVGDNGMVEIKCPKTTTQLERFLSGEFPSTYKAQVQGQLWVSEREWCDFISFDPRINGAASYFEIRVERDEEYIKLLRKEVHKFSVELRIMLGKLLQLGE